MAGSRMIQIRVSEEIDDAIREWCEANETEVSELLRVSALIVMERLDLIGTMRKPGKPKKAE